VDSLRRTVTHLGVKNPVVRLRTPDQAPHFRALMAEVRSALSLTSERVKGEDAKQALTRAVQRWQELDGKKDAQVRKADYSLSLSLQPPRR
jgi:hypothetical protein